MSTERPRRSVGCGVGHGGLGGWDSRGRAALGPRSHVLTLACQGPALPKPPFFFQPPWAQLSNPSPPPLPRSPHLDQLHVRFEPLQAGLQGAQ